MYSSATTLSLLLLCILVLYSVGAWYMLLHNNSAVGQQPESTVSTTYVLGLLNL